MLLSNLTKNLLNRKFLPVSIKFVYSTKSVFLVRFNCQHARCTFQCLSATSKVSRCSTFASVLKFSEINKRLDVKNICRCFHGSSWNPDKKKDKNSSDGKKPNEYLYFPLFVMLAISATMMWLILFHSKSTISRGEVVTMRWENFIKDVLPSGEVQHININEKNPHKASAFLHPGATFNNRKVSVIKTSVSPGQNLELLFRLEESKLGIKGSHIPITNDLLDTFDVRSMIIVYLLLLGMMSYFMARNMSKSLKSVPKKTTKKPSDPFASFNVFKRFDTDVGFVKNTNVKFDDVAGMQEAKQEVVEFVQFLKNPEKYTKLGAKMPRGCLLTGPPGVGKTLLAKAVASEAGVPFIAKAGSDFVEMIGGLGARRIRQLFKKARESAPCIIYIDELDALGAARSSSTDRFSSVNSEKDQTLNQILVEMDGMLSKQHQVVVLASTNRPDILDKALLRPGRFDRLIQIELPTRLERKEILERHLKDIKLVDNPDTFSTQLANETPGMSGADLANISNEAAIYAAREGDDKVEWKHLNYALERVTSGAPKSTTSLSPEERRKVAVHESGHALIGWLLEHTNALAKVTIIPRSKGILGITRTIPSDRYLHSQEQMFDNMCMALGGRAAENLIFGNVTQGAQDDLDRVTKMAYAQVKKFGFNDEVGPVSFKDEGRAEARPYSEALATVIDVEVKKLISSAYERTQKVLDDNKQLLETLISELLERETLTYDEVVNLIGPPPYKDKKQIFDIPFQEVDSDNSSSSGS